MVLVVGRSKRRVPRMRMGDEEGEIGREGEVMLLLVRHHGGVA
jgi:hypothetical protein